MSEKLCCKVCGAEIQRPLGENRYRYLQRKVCLPDTDTKEIPCYRQNIINTNTKREGQQTGAKAVGTKRKPQPIPLKMRGKRQKMSKQEIERLEKIQKQINIACHIRDAERCGYICSPGRLLTREEIAKVAHLYAPPSKPISKDYNPHYRSNLSRRGVEL